MPQRAAGAERGRRRCAGSPRRTRREEAPVVVELAVMDLSLRAETCWIARRMGEGTRRGENASGGAGLAWCPVSNFCVSVAVIGAPARAARASRCLEKFDFYVLREIALRKSASSARSERLNSETLKRRAGARRR